VFLPLAADQIGQLMPRSINDIATLNKINSYLKPNVMASGGSPQKNIGV